MGKYIAAGRLNSIGLRKIEWAVRGGTETGDVEACRRSIGEIEAGTKQPIRPRNMLWGRLDHDRLTYLV